LHQKVRTSASEDLPFPKNVLTGQTPSPLSVNVLYGWPLKFLAQEHNKRTCRPIFTLSLFYAERQTGKTEKLNANF